MKLIDNSNYLSFLVSSTQIDRAKSSLNNQNFLS